MTGDNTEHLHDDQTPLVVERGDIAAPWARHMLAVWSYRGFILAVLDASTIVLCFTCGYMIRTVLGEIGWMDDDSPPFFPYLTGALILSFAWMISLWRDRQYDGSLLTMRELFFTFQTIVVAGSKALIMLMAASYLFRDLLSSRFVYLFAWFASLLLIMIYRKGYNAINLALKREGLTVHRVLILGVSTNSVNFAAMLNENESPAIVVGIIDHEAGVNNGEECSPPLALLRQIKEKHQRLGFNKLIVTEHLIHELTELKQRHEFIEILNFCEHNGIELFTLPSLLDVSVVMDEVGSFFGKPLIQIQDANLHPFYQIIKRLIDISGSVFGLLLGAPLWLMVALLIKLDSKGPVIYQQKRIGMNGRPFSMYKFRSMVHDADEQLQNMINFDSMNEPVFNIRNDARVTTIGWWLRRTSLDEIPQLLNVLLGDMSLVGPRPEREDLVTRYNAWQWRRLKAKPGITGYQQIMSRGDPSLQRRIEYDLFYLKHQGFILDVFILLKTILVVLRGDGMK